MSYEKVQAFINLYSQLQSFSQDEIIQKIPPQKLEEIKQKDSHPFFQLYSVCHEGTSRPKIEGKGYKPITWFKKAIQSIKNVFKPGVKFFDGHNITNDNQDKKILGEVIHAFEEMINGKLHYCTIGYFPPETRDIAKTKDICSQEAEWDLINVAGHLFADICRNVTGIALANSNDNMQPAFKEAKRLAYVQAFNISSSGKDVLSGQDNKGDSMDLNTVPFNELTAELKRRHTLPSQIYSIDEIKKDKEFNNVFDELGTLKTNLQAKETELEKFKADNTKLNRSIQLQNAKGKLSELYKTSNLTDKMKKFIDNIYEKNKEKIDDLTDDGLKKFVDNQKEIFQLANSDIKEKNDIVIESGDTKENDKNPFLEDNYNVDDNV